MDVQAGLIFLLFALDAALLLRRYFKRRNLYIAAAFVPRLYLCVIYGWTFLFAPLLEARVVPVRFGLAYLILTEIINHLLTWRNDH